MSTSFNQQNLSMPMVWLMRSIAEYKGKQELYTKQRPQVLKNLVEIALIESAESSNRIEGVVVDRDRLKPLVLGTSRPRDRSEEEVAGYRKALNLIHRKHKDLDISVKTIKLLHELSHGGSGDAGQFKKRNNDIIRKNPNGTVDVIYRPLEAALVPKAMEDLCRRYYHAIDQEHYPDLLGVACLVFDFLCSHPFRDGNGRVSRLLTLLALYHHGYEVGKYISLERVVEQTKENYYEALNKSSQRWHEGKQEINAWLGYFLATLNSAYKEFEQRADSLKPGRGMKTQAIEEAIKIQVGNFTMDDILKMCTGVSRPMIRVVLEKMRAKGLVRLIGVGRNACWERT